MSVGPRGRDGGERGSVVDERAVSDVVGYVLVFALVTATIGTVFGVGIVGLEDRRDAERVANVERAFDVLDDNIRDIERYEDPSRATEVRLSGGTLSLSETTTVTLEYTNASGDFEYERVNVSTIAYDDDDAAVVYEAGARIRADGSASTMRSQPRFVAEDGRTVLPVVRPLPIGGSTSVGGDGTVQITTERAGSRTLQYPDDVAPDPTAIRIRIGSPYADAWEEYFEDSDAFTDVARPNDDEVVARIVHDDRVFLRVIGVDVGFNR
jgi:hypothetical protein